MDRRADITTISEEPEPLQQLSQEEDLKDLPTKKQLTRPQKLWEQLRNHVRKGFFTHLLNQDVRRTGNALSEISNLWEKVQKYSRQSGGVGGVEKDSPRSRSKQQPQQHLGAQRMFDPRLGLTGLSLDYIPNNNISSALRGISKALGVRVDEADFYNAQIQYNRGWKLLLLGLTQTESVARYLSMMGLHKVIKTVNETLLDQLTRDSLIKTLLNLMISDERKENRLKAVYLLGELGFFLGAVREHDSLLLSMYRELAKRLLQIQMQEKSAKLSGTQLAIMGEERRALKITLFHAVGKFTSAANKYSAQIEDLMIYLIHEEFSKGEANLKADEPDGSGIYVVKALLDIINSQIRPTEYNRVYIGALFKKFIHPLMKHKAAGVQMEAVQFVSNWLPVEHDDALLTGLEVLGNGLTAFRDLMVPDFNKTIYTQEKIEIDKRHKQEAATLAMRSKLLRQLLQPPGTFAKLEPVTEFPGFFADLNSSFLYSSGCVVQLPIHPRSLVTITRLLPGIPGVPANATTVPPVFMDPAWAEKQTAATSRYQWLERNGRIPGIAIGYVRGPGPVIEATIETAESTMLGQEVQQRIAETIPPADATMKGSSLRLNEDSAYPGYVKNPPRLDAMDSKRVPAGFLTSCPFPGVDIEKMDRHNRPSSAIYGATGQIPGGASSDCPEGFTFDRHPVLWPSRSVNLRTPTESLDFPINAPVLFDIIQPTTQSLQRTLCRVASVNKTLTAVSVSGDNTQQGEVDSSVILAVGTLLNVYLWPRDANDWLTINLEVTDDNYVDDLTVGQKKTIGKGNANTGSSYLGSAMLGGQPIPEVIASGFSATGEPYFAPPVNMPPVPVGYTSHSIAYFGKSALIKSSPAALTTEGDRLYQNGVKSRIPVR